MVANNKKAYPKITYYRVNNLVPPPPKKGKNPIFFSLEVSKLKYFITAISQ